MSTTTNSPSTIHAKKTKDLSFDGKKSRDHNAFVQSDNDERCFKCKKSLSLTLKSIFKNPK
jgi:hypothetical protein